MRIASNTVSEGIVRQLQQLGSQQSRLQGQISSGLRITQPEDDPAAVGRVLNLESERRQLEQFGLNAKRAEEWSKATFSGLQGLVKVSGRAGEVATLGTGPLAADAMKAYAVEADQLIEQALQAANAQYSGDYLYGGTAVSAPPFEATRDASGKVTSLAYQGNAAQASVQLSESSSITPGTSGSTNLGVRDFITELVKLRDALNTGDPMAVGAVQAGLLASEDSLVFSVAESAGMQTRIEASLSQQTDRRTSLDLLVSGEVATDLPTTIVKLNQVQTAYQAALQSSASIMRLSLLDYIN
jgi:flagellar hook-associated protein 3 FlgL